MNPRHRARVLVAMGEEADLELLDLAFRRDGALVCCAADGAAALEELERQSVGVVVIDLMLPIVGAIEVISAARAMRVPALVFTALDDADRRRMAFEAGAAAFYLKGQGLQDLRSAVLEYTGKQPGNRPGPSALFTAAEPPAQADQSARPGRTARPR